MSNPSAGKGYFQSLIQERNRPFVIAEIGVNHNGDIALAKDLVIKAKASGADVVKFQSFSADTVACRSALSAPHVDKALGFEGTFYELLEKLSLSHEAQRELNDFCKKNGVPFISTPFSFADVDFLVSLDVPFLKIGSTDTSHLAFLKHAAKSGKPIVLSTGMSPMAEVETAVDTILNAGNDNLALLHCVSLYPPEAEELNLKSVTALKEKFPQLVIGFSDHSIGTWACTAAVALGAEIIEKHFTLDKAMPGPDHAVSADPYELSKIIEEGSLVYRALGSLAKTPSAREAGMEQAFRRSIVSRKAIAAGTLITAEHLDFKRPGTGIHPNRLSEVIGAKVIHDIPADTPIEDSMLEMRASGAIHDSKGGQPVASR